MAITIECKLRPYSYTAKPVPIATLTIHTTDDLQHHEFTAGAMPGCKHCIRVRLPKTRSAHRNILHVIRDFLVAADLDKLGSDYITTALDTKLAREKQRRSTRKEQS